MAITQISVIQIRRGLEADLGNLASGEFAWAIDTQRLFIGNGTTDEGAPFEGITEIMTYNLDAGQAFGLYTYEGILGGYEVQTGPTSAAKITRRVKDKWDDIVNVRDFGASGNGLVDDTDAIQRAIDEVYDRKAANIRTRTRRRIYFSAGVYRITRSLKLPPYCVLTGEGQNSVFIRADGNQPAIKLSTATGGDPSDPLEVAKLHPFGVQVNDLTVSIAADETILEIDSATNVLFENVGFVGERIKPTSLGLGSCIKIMSTTEPTEQIIFRNCTIGQLGTAVNIDAVDKINHLVFEHCQFNDLYTGVTVLASGVLAPQNIRISNSYFKDIAAQAIYGAPGVSGISSIGNTFVNVGNDQIDEINIAGSPSFAVIEFNADNNFSIGDIFGRSRANGYVIPRVATNGYAVLQTSLDDALGLGDSRTTPAKTIGLTNNNSGNISLPYLSHGFINYSLDRNTNSRSGVIKFATVGTTSVVFEEEYTETDNTGVIFTVHNTSGLVTLGYVVDNQGTGCSLTYDTKTLKNY